MYSPIQITSSYSKNNLGKTLYETILELKPLKVIEFGCLYGYSTVSIALALKQLGRGKIYCYDLWESYEYKHTTLEETKRNLENHDLSEYVEFKHQDYYEWLREPEPFDLLHLDISNTGDTIAKTYEAVPNGSTVIFEGGSKQRDDVEWMKTYKYTPINSVKEKVGYKVLNSNWPSISIFTK